MTVHYVYLAFALLLLWFPRSLLRHGLRVTPKPERRYNVAASERDPHDRGVKPLTEAAKSRNWVDLLRAGAGTYGLMTAAFVPPPGLTGADVRTTVCQGVVLGVGMLIQMVRIQGRVSLFAPIFFLQGVTFGVAGGLVGALAMLGSWALSPILPGAGAILFVQGGLALCFGLLFHQAEPVSLMVMTGVIWLPMLTSVLVRKRLSAAFDKRMKIIPRSSGGGEDWGAES